MKWFVAFLLSFSLVGCNTDKSSNGQNIESEKPSEQVTSLSKNAVIIDVRTKQEWNQGHLEDAVLLSVDQFSSNIENLVADKDQPVVLYCRSGNRAGKMMKVMNELGYSQVTNAGGVKSAANLTGSKVVQ